MAAAEAEEEAADIDLVRWSAGGPTIRVQPPERAEEGFILDVHDVTRWQVARTLADFERLHRALLHVSRAVPQLPSAAKRGGWRLVGRSAAVSEEELGRFLAALAANEAIRETAVFRRFLWPPLSRPAVAAAEAAPKAAAAQAVPAGARLHVRVVQAATVKLGEEVSTFATIRMGRGKVFVTRTIKSKSPFFDESHTFYLDEMAPEEREAVEFAVWQRHSVRKNVCLGALSIPISELLEEQQQQQQTFDRWVPMSQRSTTEPGFLHVVMRLTTTEDFDSFDGFVVIGEDVPAGSDPPVRPPSGSPEDEAQLRQFIVEHSVCNTCGQQKSVHETITLEDCSATFCVQCMRSYLSKAIEQGLAEIPCQKCGAPLPQWVLKVSLPKDVFEGYLERLLQRAVDDHVSIIRCPNPACHYVLERVEPAQIDPALSETERHYAAFRMRCPACSTIFCAECMRIPYHDGHTCASYAAFLAAKHCRFCGSSLASCADDGLDVCNSDECREKLALACYEKLECGHWCCGVRCEAAHPPCLQEDCPSAHAQAGQFCNICWVEELASAPCVQLKCGHIFHFVCIRQRIERRWQGPIINFGFLECPLCNAPASHPALEELLKPLLKLKSEVEACALQRLEHEHLGRAREITDPSSPFHNKPADFAMHRFLYSQCSKCKKPFFAGLRQCQDAAAAAAAEEEEAAAAADQEELVCSLCSGSTRLQGVTSCKKHGTEAIQWKCKYCCSIASWYCGEKLGHFCASCHKRQCSGDYLNRKPISELPRCPGPEQCPLHIAHPPNGTEFSLGCILCRNLQSF